MNADLSDLLASKKRYGTIFADPPWPERGSGRIKRGANRHYPLMEVKAIIAMGDVVQQLAKPSSHLYLWMTNNFLPAALEVMKAWGFRYVTMITWMKDRECRHRAVLPGTHRTRSLRRARQAPGLPQAQKWEEGHGQDWIPGASWHASLPEARLSV